MIQIDKDGIGFYDGWALLASRGTKTSGVIYPSRASARAVAKGMRMRHRVVPVRVIFCVKGRT